MRLTPHPLSTQLFLKIYVSVLNSFKQNVSSKTLISGHYCSPLPTWYIKAICQPKVSFNKKKKKFNFLVAYNVCLQMHQKKAGTNIDLMEQFNIYEVSVHM